MASINHLKRQSNRLNENECGDSQKMDDHINESRFLLIARAPIEYLLSSPETAS